MTESNVEVYILPPVKNSSSWILQIITPDGTVTKKSPKPYSLLRYAYNWAESRNMSFGVISTHALPSSVDSSDATNIDPISV
jgi:hypothetical protein